MVAPPRSPIDWTTLYLDSFHEIERVIRLTQGFVLLPVEAPGPDPGRALGEWLTAQGYPAVIHEPRDDKAWEEIAGALYETEVAPSGVVLVLGGPVLPKGFYEGVWLLNQKRDPIVKKLARPLLWCGPAAMLALMWERAPDLWSIRAVGRRLVAAPRSGAQSVSTQLPGSGPLYDVNLDPEVVALRQSLAGSSYHALRPMLDLARRLTRADDLAAADELLDKTTATHRSVWVVQDLIDARLLRASVARRQGRLASARKYLDQAESLLHPPNPYLSPRLRLEDGRIALDEGNLEEARDAFEQALGSSRRRSDPSLEVEAGLALATLYLNTPGPEGAQRALAVLDQFRARPVYFASQGGRDADVDSEVDILTTRARALAAAGSAAEAESALSAAARRIHRTLPPAGHAAALLIRIAHTAIDIGASDRAKHLATRALTMARAAGDTYAERHAAEALDRARQPTT